MNNNFEERAKTLGDRLERRLDGLQHEMQQSSLVEEAKVKRERIGERGNHAAVSLGNGNT